MICRHCKVWNSECDSSKDCWPDRMKTSAEFTHRLGEVRSGMKAHQQLVEVLGCLWFGLSFAFHLLSLLGLRFRVVGRVRIVRVCEVVLFAVCVRFSRVYWRGEHMKVGGRNAPRRKDAFKHGWCRQGCANTEERERRARMRDKGERWSTKQELGKRRTPEFELEPRGDRRPFSLRVLSRARVSLVGATLSSFTLASSIS